MAAGVAIVAGDSPVPSTAFKASMTCLQRMIRTPDSLLVVGMV